MKLRGCIYLCFAVVTIWSAVALLPDDNVHVVFCDVGQGDAALITWRRVQILVDGGPSNEVVRCLERHVPFFDKRIEMVVLTHPQVDHLTGLISVVERYRVTRFVVGPEGGKGEKFDELMRLITEKQIVSMPLVSGDVIGWKHRGAQLRFEVLWPTREFLAETSESVDVNQYSRVGKLVFGNFEVLLAGDADIPVQDKQLLIGEFGKIEVLKVPHHGSRLGMTDEWLKRLRPDLAVISVGENNYGHPANEALLQLTRIGSEIKRTDLDGEIEVVSDGKRWWVK